MSKEKKEKKIFKTLEEANIYATFLIAEIGISKWNLIYSRFIEFSDMFKTRG